MNLVSFKKPLALFLSVSSVFAAAVSDDLPVNTLSCPDGTTKIVEALYSITADDAVKAGLTKFLSTTPLTAKLSDAVTSETFAFPTNTTNLNASCDIFKQGVFVQALDYSDGQGSADKINGIVASKTKGHIDSIVTPGDFRVGPTMVTLLHVTHLETTWIDKFKEKSVHFKRPSGEKVVLDAFGIDCSNYTTFLETDEATVVLLEAKDDLRLYLRLDKVDGKVGGISPVEIKALEERIPAFQERRELRKNLLDAQKKTGFLPPYDRSLFDEGFKDACHLVIPTFKIESKIDLLTTLSCLPKGEFAVDLFAVPTYCSIGSCLQKNVIDVTKEGMKASSATAMICRSLSASKFAKKEIFFDRPFSIMVTSGKTVLFEGAVYDPAS